MLWAKQAVIGDTYDYTGKVRIFPSRLRMFMIQIGLFQLLVLSVIYAHVFENKRRQKINKSRFKQDLDSTSFGQRGL